MSVIHYVSETEKQLKIRFPEHTNHINRNTPSNSIITKHRLIHNHDFDWENIQIFTLKDS